MDAGDGCGWRLTRSKPDPLSDLTAKQGSTPKKDKGKAPASTSRPGGRFQLVDEYEDEDEDEHGAEYQEEEEKDIGDNDVGEFDDVNPEHMVLDDDDDDV